MRDRTPAGPIEGSGPGGEAFHLLGDLITFTIKRADVRTANLGIARLGDRLERIVRDDLSRRPVWGEVFADEVAYHATHVARACLETDDEENLAALAGLVERVAVALLETGHGPAASPLLGHLVHLGRELVRRADGVGLVAVLAALGRIGRTFGAEAGAHLVDAAASALGTLGAGAAVVRFDPNPLETEDERAAEPARVALDALEALARGAVDRGLDGPAAACLAQAAAVGRAAAEADDGSAVVPAVAAVLRRAAERAAQAGRAATVAAAIEALADLAEAGRRLDRAPVVEAALQGLTALGAGLEGVDLALPAAAGTAAGESGAAACARHLRLAGEGYEYLIARALRAAGEGPFRRRFQTGLSAAKTDGGR